jgi:hypothetical protein
LKPLFGDVKDSIFHRVTAVQLSCREVPDALLKLRYLESVSLSRCRMSPAQLDRLNRRSLKSLLLHDNQLEDDGSNQAAVAASPAPAWQQLDWGEKTNEALCQVDAAGSGFACPSSPSAVK